MPGIARKFLASLILMPLLTGCGPAQPDDPLERRAEAYVRLALDLGRLRPEEVDAYFGPARLDRRAEPDGPALPELRMQAEALAADIAAAPADPDPVRAARRLRLAGKAEHLATLLGVIEDPRALTFVEEARQLYGIELPTGESPVVREAIDELERLLPGRGTLPFRLASFRNQLLVPGDRREAVFERALEECRRRTLEQWDIQREQLSLEWSREIQAAWYRYEGEGVSALRVNPLAVAYIGEALDVACHEAYPGHHAQFALFESEGLAVEDTVVLLRSPASVLREGAAIYGVSLAFPPQERLAFERDVLFPLAGISTEGIEKYLRVHELVGALADAVIPVVLEYRDGELGPNSATFRLQREALVSSPEQLLSFVDTYGAYSLGYTVARTRLRDYVEARATEEGLTRWEVLRQVLAVPQPERVFAGERFD